MIPNYFENHRITELSLSTNIHKVLPGTLLGTRDTEITKMQAFAEGDNNLGVGGRTDLQFIRLFVRKSCGH